MDVSVLLLLLGVLVLVVGYWACRYAHKKRIDRQRLYVEAWQEAEERHPGLYTRQVAEETAKLEQMRTKKGAHPLRLPGLDTRTHTSRDYVS